MKRFVSCCLALAVMAGCVQIDTGMSPAQRSAGEGALVGAAVGGGVGALLGDRNRGSSAALGAAIGALLGGAGGYYVGSQNQQYASAEQAYDARIYAAHQEAASYRQVAEASDEVLREHRSRLAELQAQYRQRRLDARAVSAEEAALRQDVDELSRAAAERDRLVDTIGQDIQHFRAQGRNTRELEAARAQIMRDSVQLERNIDQLARALSGLPPVG